MLITEKTRCAYHSKTWEHLAEQGWATVQVDSPHPDGGWRMCEMIRQTDSRTRLIVSGR